MKTWSFFFHYNKPASTKKKMVQWSIHFRNRCYVVNQIICKRPVQSKVNKRQPVAVMKGTAKSVSIIDGCGYIE